MEVDIVKPQLFPQIPSIDIVVRALHNARTPGSTFIFTSIRKCNYLRSGATLNRSGSGG